MSDVVSPEHRGLVSVVVPTYDRPDMVREAARVVAAQTYDDVELIVVDDHSPTPAETALADAALDDVETVRYLRHSQNRGVSAARNTGIRAATGEYVAFLDDDDRWDERKLAAQVRAFRESDDDVGVVYTGIEYTSETGSTTDIPTLRGDVTHDLLVGRSLAPTSTVMARRAFLDRIDGFDEQLPSWNDRDLYVRLSQQCEFEPVPEVLTVRLAGHGSEQISRDYETKRDVSHPRFVSKHRPTAASYGWRCERRFLAATSLALARAARVNGCYRESRRLLLESIRWYPFDTDAYTQLVPVLGGRYTYEPAQFVYHLTGRVVRRLPRFGDGQR